jgi:hypothetical protein
VRDVDRHCATVYACDDHSPVGAEEHHLAHDAGDACCSIGVRQPAALRPYHEPRFVPDRE